MTKRPSPYQGLAPFEEKDAPYFFGRDSEMRLIVADLHAAQLTLLYGASGVGKSSVLRAGVLPLLRKRNDVLVVVFNGWKDDPLTGLKKEVEKELLATTKRSTKAYEAYTATIRRHRNAPLRDFLTALAKRARRRLMIILDQFEEYSLYHPEDDGFAAEFPACTTIDDFSVSFLVSLREEAVARLDRFEGRIPALFDNYRRIEHLSDGAARQAIERPLEQYNEDHSRQKKMIIEPDLVKAVIDQVRSGQIAEGSGGTGGTGGIGGAALTTAAGRQSPIESPYLQLVMSRLWTRERNQNSAVLQLSTLNELGSAAAIVEGHLESVMSRLSETDCDLAARVFQHLVTPSGSKIAYSVQDLSIIAGVDAVQLEKVLSSLSRGTDRILRPIPPPEPGGASRYEIFHDRLTSAILKWRARYLKDQEVTIERQRELERRKQAAGAAASEPHHPTSHAGPAPPYTLLASLFQAQKIIVVIGAGVSASARPTNSSPWKPGSPFLPTGWELAQQLAAESDFPADNLPTSTLAEVVSYFEAEFGRRPLYERLDEIFLRPYTISPTHRFLARVSAKYPQVILTTTIDRLMEEALRSENVGFDTVVASRESLGSRQLVRP